MRRPIIGLHARVETNLDVSPGKQTAIRLEGAALEKRLRLKRSKTFVEAMTRLDVSGVVANKVEVQELIDKIANEFPELAGGSGSSRSGCREAGRCKRRRFHHR